MDDSMKRFQQDLVELETEAEHLLLARTQLVDIDRLRNGNREALTALRRKARTTRSSVPSPFKTLMKDIGGSGSRPLMQEVCATCGEHDPGESTWMMFSGADVFASVPFHAAHTVLEEDQSRLEFEAKRLQSYVKEKSFAISEKGALADRISPGVLRSLVALKDNLEQANLLDGIFFAIKCPNITSDIRSNVDAELSFALDPPTNPSCRFTILGWQNPSLSVESFSP